MLQENKACKYLNISSVKRDQMLKIERQNRKLQMRAALPILSREQVIRYRLPPHLALIRAVEQDGFPSASEYMKQLVEFQECLRDSFGPDTHVWSMPRLLLNIPVLEELRNSLINAEDAHNAGNYSLEVQELLKLAVEFAFGEEHWWWIGHQLMEQSIAVSLDFAKDGGQSLAACRYAFGKFLLEQVTDTDAALIELNIARNLSAGMSWNVRHIFNTKHQGTIYSEVSILLYKVLVKQAKNIMKTDPFRAIKLCSAARKAAIDGCEYIGETEAHILKGECEMLIYDTSNAILSFRRALAVQIRHEDPKWKCEVLVHLAVASLKHGLLSSALDLLKELREYGKEHGLNYYVAQSYKNLGEYYLREGMPMKSTPLLKYALRLFNKGNHIFDAENTRNFTAISIGIDLLKPFIELITNCDGTSLNADESLTKLLRWKDMREPFIEITKAHSVLSVSSWDMSLEGESEEEMLLEEETVSEESSARAPESSLGSSNSQIEESDTLIFDPTDSLEDNGSTAEEEKPLITLHMSAKFDTDDEKVYV